MALNASGPISLAGSTAGQSIALELGLSATGAISLNQTNVRSLAGVASGAITMPTNFWGKSSHIPFSTKVTYTTNSTLVAPYATIRVKAWGAGAAGSTGTGGAGGFAQADISVTVGSTLNIYVGTGGPSNGAGVPGGGAGSSGALTGFGGGGGGYSGVFIGTQTQANAKIIGGAGGGGSVGSGNAAGAGGGSTAQSSATGAGGTQTTGYAALQGGPKGSLGGGGGGGGYWGGVGNTAGAGGGGSGYVTGTNTTLTTGNRTTPANTGDVDYVAGKAIGTSSGATGGAGYVVIYY